MLHNLRRKKLIILFPNASVHKEGTSNINGPVIIHDVFSKTAINIYFSINEHVFKIKNDFLITMILLKRYMKCFIY